MIVFIEESPYFIYFAALSQEKNKIKVYLFSNFAEQTDEWDEVEL